MQNLAGREEAARVAQLELERCGIPIFDAETTGEEVNSQCMGMLDVTPGLQDFGKHFEFKRAWSYWIVSGPVPLKVAQKLYEDPVGETDIRVAGHCACPPPEYPWVECHTVTGKRLYKLRSPEEQAREEASMDKYMPGWRDEYEYVNDPSAVATQSFVTSYHIDTELGLYIFVQALRAYGVVDE